MSKKPLVIGLSVLVVVAVVGLVLLFSNLNALIAKAIEKHGSSATGTTVAVGGVDVSLREGRGAIAGLRIGSPSGYQSRDAFRLGRIAIDLDVASVRKEPIVIDRLEITAPEIFAEFQKDGGSNLTEIRKHLEQFAPEQRGTSGSSSSGAQEKRIRIRELVVAEGRIAVDASKLGIESQSLTLPSIRLSDVGGANGSPPDQLAKVILTSLVSRATSEIGRSEVERRVRGALGDSFDKAKGLLDKLK